MTNGYFAFLGGKVELGKHHGYTDLLRFLSEREFNYTMLSWDENRARDGRILRHMYRQQYEDRLPAGLAVEFDDWCNESFCTWLEMLVKFAMRLEEQIAEYGQNKVPLIFWMLIDNMFDRNCSNAYFNPDDCEAVIRSIEAHERGLCTEMFHPGMDIWAQGMAILNEYLAKIS